MPRIPALLAAIGGVSNPGKMPGHGWSIPAETCQRGAILARVAGAICAVCYALRGRYQMSNTQAAMRRRFAILTRALANPEHRALFVAAFAALLNKRRASWHRGRTQDQRYFRWHDSGDLQSPGHLALIVAICKATPTVRHWLPTRERDHVRRYLESGGEIPGNLCVRISADLIGQLPTITAAAVTLAGSTAHASGEDAPAGAVSCGAWRRDGACGGCRRCWYATWPVISYPEH
jgi:hypothetical protein